MVESIVRGFWNIYGRFGFMPAIGYLQNLGHYMPREQLAALALLMEHPMVWAAVVEHCQYAAWARKGSAP